MTDQPASWLADPTGRHDHRYWDGTGWTDHVADAGVAATDPYDGPADAAPDTAGSTAGSTADDTSTSGWASSGEPAAEPTPTTSEAAAGDATFSMSGWGATAREADEDTEPASAVDQGGPAGEAAVPDAAASPWGASSTPSWGAPAPVQPERADDQSTDQDAIDDAGEVGDVAASDAFNESVVPTWGAPADAAPAEVAPSSTWDDPTRIPPSTSTWGTPISPTPAPSTTTHAPTGGAGGRKGIILVLALAAIAAIVIALVLTGDDDGGTTDGAEFARKFGDQIQAQTRITDEQAQCVGEYVVDEIGESRLQNVEDLQQRTAPAELQADFDQAVQRSFTECDIDQADLQPPVPGGTDAASPGVTDLGAAQSQALTEQQYRDYYKEALGLSDEDAQCLASHSADAEAAGTADPGDGISQFYQWVDECGIDSDELFQTIATADSSNASG